VAIREFETYGSACGEYQLADLGSEHRRSSRVDVAVWKDRGCRCVRTTQARQGAGITPAFSLNNRPRDPSHSRSVHSDVIGARARSPFHLIRMFDCLVIALRGIFSIRDCLISAAPGTEQNAAASEPNLVRYETVLLKPCLPA
jgi:hypothetical protein